jgi:hypothetical protein
MRRNAQIIDISEQPEEAAETFVPKIVKDWWPSIDWTVTATLRQLGEPIHFGERSLARIGPHDYIGCGSWGCVYPLDTTDRWLVKVTTDPTEGPIVAHIMKHRELRNHRGIVYYGGLWQLDERVHLPSAEGDEMLDLPIYVILREYAAVWPHAWPWDEPHMDEMNEYEYFMSEATTSSLALLNIQDQMEYVRKSRLSQAVKERRLALLMPEWQEFEEEYLDNLEDLQNTLFGRAIADFLRIVYLEHSILMPDLHKDNIGIRVDDLRNINRALPKPGDWLSIIDPGHSRVPGAVIPTLSRHVMQNPIPVIHR